MPDGIGYQFAGEYLSGTRHHGMGKVEAGKEAAYAFAAGRKGSRSVRQGYEYVD